MKIAIIGNSGSGKTTLARQWAKLNGARLLELDSIYWEPGKIAEKRTPSAMEADLQNFAGQDSNWIIEGCYGSLIEVIKDKSDLLIFMNPGVDTCIANNLKTGQTGWSASPGSPGVDTCIANNLKRPWEPEKYQNATDQQEKLEYLLQWVRDYYVRDDEMSLRACLEIRFAAFSSVGATCL
jgi:uridine kinase